MKKDLFKQAVAPLREGDIIILTIRAHSFMQKRENSFSPLAHCVFIKANSDFIEVRFEGTINPNGIISNGDKLPNRVNYARIEKIEKIADQLK